MKHLNNQPVTLLARDTRKDSPGELQVHSVFKTIQGEGPLSGTPAIFIRLSGCNLQCPACDTEYTIQSMTMPYPELADVVYTLAEGAVKLVVITGGEPLRQRLSKLIEELTGVGFQVQIETNGTCPPPAIVTEGYNAHLVSIVCSPKAPKIHPRLKPFVHAYKYVYDFSSEADARNKFDTTSRCGIPCTALGLSYDKPVALPDFDKPIYLSPADTRDTGELRANMDAITDIALTFNYKISLQLHKILGVQ